MDRQPSQNSARLGKHPENLPLFSNTPSKNAVTINAALTSTALSRTPRNFSAAWSPESWTLRKAFCYG